MYLDLPIEQIARRKGMAFQFVFATEAKELVPQREEFADRVAQGTARPGRLMDSLIVTQADHALLMLLGLHADLQRELERAIVVSSEAVPPDVVTMNSTVVYSDETAGVQRSVRIVYPRDANASEGRISVRSPIGTALLGLSVGQSIDWDFPDGSSRTLKVDELVHQPERRLRPIQHLMF